MNLITNISQTMPTKLTYKEHTGITIIDYKVFSLITNNFLNNVQGELPTKNIRNKAPT